MTHEIWWKLYRWLRKSHPSKSATWLRRRYVRSYSPIDQTQTFQMKGVKLYLPSLMPITRFRMVKSGLRVGDAGGSEGPLVMRGIEVATLPHVERRLTSSRSPAINPSKGTEPT